MNLHSRPMSQSNVRRIGQLYHTQAVRYQQVASGRPIKHPDAQANHDEETSDLILGKAGRDFWSQRTKMPYGGTVIRYYNGSMTCISGIKHVEHITGRIFTPILDVHIKIGGRIRRQHRLQCRYPHVSSSIGIDFTVRGEVMACVQAPQLHHRHVTDNAFHPGDRPGVLLRENHGDAIQTSAHVEVQDMGPGLQSFSECSERIARGQSRRSPVTDHNRLGSQRKLR